MTRLRIDGGKNPERRKAAERGAVDLDMQVDGMPLGMTIWPARFRKTVLTYAVPMADDFIVDTLEGEHLGRAGDYLAIGPAGEMYPINRDVFKASYERVEE